MERKTKARKVNECTNGIVRLNAERVLGVEKLL